MTLFLHFLDHVVIIGSESDTCLARALRKTLSKGDQTVFGSILS